MILVDVQFYEITMIQPIIMKWIGDAKMITRVGQRISMREETRVKKILKTIPRNCYF